MKTPKRSRTTGKPTAREASAGADHAGAVDRSVTTRKGDPASPTLDGGAEIARPSRAFGDVVTLSPTEAAELLGLGRTKTYHLLKPLTRVEWSSAKRPRYRRDDVLGLTGASSPKPVLAIDAGRKVAKGWEHLTVEEFDAATAETKSLRQTAHLADPDD